MTTLQVRKLKAFGTKVQLDACRELSLLRAIEETLDVLDLRCENLRQANEAADRNIALLRADDVTRTANADVDLVALFEKARDAVALDYEESSRKHFCAINAPELNDEDGIVESYALLLTEIAALHDKLNTLCWLIGEREADQDLTLPGVFSSADELFAAMGV